MENRENELDNLTEEILSPDENLPETKELLTLIAEKRYREFRSIISEIPAVDIARMLDDVPEESINIFYRLLPKEAAADVFIEMDSEVQEHLISLFTDNELSEMLEELYLDDTVDIIEEMPANVVKRILRNSSRENRSIINQLLHYPKDSAGTIMTTEYVRFTKDQTVEQALTHIRRVAIDKETIYNCYVTDKDRCLIGLVTAKALMLSSPDTVLEDIMEDSVIFVSTTDDKEEVALKFNKYGFIALPVVDNEGRLVGIVTVDDAIDVLKEEADEDFAKIAAITPDDTPYVRQSAFNLFKARIPWLLFLMISATISGAILGFFEGTLLPVLTIFLPMLMGTGGNSGSQSSVTAIRALGSGEMTGRDLPRIFFKELRVGIMCGALLAVVSFGKIMLIDRWLLGNEAVTVTVAIAVSVTLAAIIVASKLVGCTLPVAAKAIGLDPAVMASPLITTLVDVLALLVYFVISANVFGLVV